MSYYNSTSYILLFISLHINICIFRCVSTQPKKVPIYLLFQRCLLRFFTGLFCVASITNSCMLNLLPVLKYEHMYAFA